MNFCPACAAPTVSGSRYCTACGASLLGAPAATLPAPTAVSAPAAVEAQKPKSTDRLHSIEGRFLPGTLLVGRYRIVGLLGRGGMGEVYRADDTKLGQTVALKFLPEMLARDAQSLEGFYAEVRIGRQVSHPNVCRMYDLVDVDGQYCVAMEYVDGEDLAKLLQRIGRLPTDKAVEIARELCAGVAAAHDKGVIHRDLKPANIMLDGRGRVRITDFGLAAFATDLGDAVLAGTPAYMAPEQLAGQPASMQSDLYALGLTLYEIFVGKRLFDGRSIEELKEQHDQIQRPSLSDAVRDIPPAVEQAILRCLESKPESRPASAHAVGAALPGGDPLQAALAAGETPSPAMVAAAGKIGDLNATAAWSLLIAALLGMLLIAYWSAANTVIGRLQPDKSPEVLAEKAREILAKIGHADRAAATASWFWFDSAQLEFLAKQDPKSAARIDIATARPAPMIFMHRQSPQPLVALRMADLIALPTDVGRLSRDDPPMDVPGMTRVTLDRHGTLIDFLAVPPHVDAAATTRAVDWSALLDAAGFSAADLTPTTPLWTAPVDSDAKFAWNGAYPDQAQVPIHIEAAAYHGRPVWFAVQGPWVQAPVAKIDAAVRLALWVVLAFGVFLLVGMVAMLRRNVRLGRGDRRGAWTLARVIFVTLLVALLLRADHAPSIAAEVRLVTTILTQALYFALITWTLYVAFEPYARRRWPELMISWSRLLSGRLRDPLVGRDAMIGALVGIAMLLVLHLDVLLPTGFGHTQRAPFGLVITPMSAMRNVVFFFMIQVYTAVGLPLSCLIGLYVFRSLLRFNALALPVLFAIVYLFFTVATTNGVLWSPANALLAGLWLLLLMRVGLLAAAVASYFFFMLWYTPLTLDFDAWYAGRTLLALGVLSALLLYAFHCSLAGKSAIGRVLGENDAER